MTRRDTSVPPGPRGNRLVGSAIELRRGQIHAYERAMREHGDVVRFVVGPPGLRFDLYAVFHPDGVRRVLAGSREVYSKGNRFYEMIAAALGRGLLTSEGPLWQRQRRLIQPLFTRKAIAGYADLMTEEAVAVADRWERTAGEVDANADMVDLTLRVVGRAIFGGDVDRAAEVVDWAFPVLNGWTFRRAVSPVATPVSWPTPANRAAARAQRALYAAIDELIAERSSNGHGDDLLSRLVGARDADTGEAMDLQQVRDEALIFLLAGHETTSTALTFTLHLLGRETSEQERVHDEIDAVLGGRLPTLGDVPALERTAMAIKEAMRLYPPAYALGRLLNREDEIGGHRIPAGAFVAVSQWATHRHREFWEDPEAFDPGRFTAEQEKERHPYAYFPFGGGPRSCIGSHFAMLEAVIAVAVLLQRHRVASRPEAVTVDTNGITLRPKGAVPLAATSRRAGARPPSG
jgi:cytochrome P450